MSNKLNKKIIAIILNAFLVIGITSCGTNSGNSSYPESNITSEKSVSEDSLITEESSNATEAEISSADPYEDLNAFIESFNSSSDIKIVSQEQIDIHDKTGGYYRTEFRLSAFDDAIAYHIVFDDNSSADMIDTVNWSSGETVNGSIARIYVLAESKESLESIFRTACKVMHSDITDTDIDEAIEKMMQPYGYEEMEYLYSGGSGYVGDSAYTYDIREKNTFFEFFLD